LYEYKKKKLIYFLLVVIRDFVVRIESQSDASRKKGESFRREKNLFDDREWSRCYSTWKNFEADISL
jgi:hypothetical protein